MKAIATVGVLALFAAGAAAKVYKEPLIIAPGADYVDGLEAAIKLQSQGLAECVGFDGSTCSSINRVKWTGAEAGNAVSSVLIEGNEVVLTYPVQRANAAICSLTEEGDIRLATAVTASSLQADLEKQNAIINALRDEFSQRSKTICAAYLQTASKTFKASTYEGWYTGPLHKASDMPEETVTFGPGEKFTLRNITQADTSAGSLPKAETANVKHVLDDRVFTPKQRALISEYDQLDGGCRGGPGIAAATWHACAKRDVFSPKMRSANLCYGKNSNQSMSEMYWHICGIESADYDHHSVAASFGKCRVTLEGKTVLEGACLIDLQEDGSFWVMDPKQQIFASVDRATGGAVASMHEDRSGLDENLGDVSRRGACWKNDKIEICAWGR